MGAVVLGLAPSTYLQSGDGVEGGPEPWVVTAAPPAVTEGATARLVRSALGKGKALRWGLSTGFSAGIGENTQEKGATKK